MKKTKRGLTAWVGVDFDGTLIEWCEKHIGQRLKVTCEKDPGMLYLLDDRAVHVIRNTGHFDMPSDIKVD